MSSATFSYVPKPASRRTSASTGSALVALSCSKRSRRWDRAASSPCCWHRQLRRYLVQAALGLLAERCSTGCAFDGCLQALASLGQAAGRALPALAGLVVLFQLIHVK